MKKLTGTFQLNSEKKIHSWYPYLAGFSSHLVMEKIKEYGLTSDSKIFDPFSGVGTTLLEAKLHNISSDGVEINPFVSFVANTKLEMNYDQKELTERYNSIKFDLTSEYKSIQIEDQPELLRRVFSKEIFKKLLFIKRYINNFTNEKIRNLFLLALISILKEVSNCKNFSPYIEMKDKPLLDAEIFQIYLKKIASMIKDISDLHNTTHSQVINGDARFLDDFEDKTYDLILTSPPYLNNWDYSWITKIELFFLDFIKNNQELTTKLRNNLMKSSTYVLQNVSKESSLNLPESNTRTEIERLIKNLYKERLSRSNNAKKYDIAVREYFNDVYQILCENYRILKKGSNCLWVVGDSALYGNHVATDRLIGEIGELVGFKFEGLDVLRSRRATRHKINLQESIVILKK